MKTKRLTTLAILVALAAVLSWLENLIPLQMVVPLPGVKLGLANVSSAFALYTLGPGAAVMVIAARCLIANVMSGNLTGLLFSLTGGLMSIGAMTMGRKTGRLSVYGVSALGAAAFNLGQVSVAMVMMHSWTVGLYLPYLLLIGTACAMGTATVLAGVLYSPAAASAGLPEKKSKTRRT